MIAPRIIAALILTLVLSVLVASVPASASPGDDTSYELGVWGFHYYPNLGWGPLPAPEMGAGMSDGLATTFYTGRDIRIDTDAKERHLRDPQFQVNGYYGNDQYSFDKNDIGLIVAHGDANNIWFDTTTDRHNVDVSTVRWGNWDLEYVMIFS